jgi:hypothetical protein
MRAIFEAVGAVVTWDQQSLTATGRTAEHTVTVTVGAAVGIVDGAPVALDAPGRILGGRTMLPIRFLAESLGAEVAWDGVTQTVSITT